MSDWRERANKRRDERHTAIPEDQHPRGGRGKNTKKWCKGKVGREHKLECRPDSRYPGSCRVLACTECGKQIDYYFPVSWWPEPRPKPAWVVN